MDKHLSQSRTCLQALTKRSPTKDSLMSSEAGHQDGSLPCSCGCFGSTMRPCSWHRFVLHYTSEHTTVAPLH